MVTGLNIYCISNETGSCSAKVGFEPHPYRGYLGTTFKFISTCIS